MQITENIDQIKKLIGNSQRILVATRRHSDLDGVGALLGWYGVLVEQEKEVTLLSEGLLASNFAFLSHADQVQNSLPPKSLVVSIDLQNNPIEKINYETKDGKFELIITPKEGMINAESVEFFQTDLNFDLVISVSSPKLSLLGEVAHLHKGALEEISLINIDCTSENDLFGKINLVDVFASSTCEVVAALFGNLGWQVSSEVATSLLAGIMDKTRSFQKGVTAQTFAVAGRLVEAGADLRTLSQNLFDKAAIEAKATAISPKIVSQNPDNDQPLIR